jgi:lipopolysaccharide biosynthesis glycosyltransferase
VDSRKNLLVTLADKNYLPQAKQLFSGVYWNAGWSGDYMLLSHEIPEEDLKWFRDKGIFVKKCDLLLESRWGAQNECSPVIADKFYLFLEEFKRWKNIVFLDSDILVKGSLYGLTKIKYFGAVQDVYFNRLNIQFYGPFANKFNNKIYNWNVPAFNGGVLTFHTDIITPGLFNEISDLLKNHVAEFVYGEQTALNIYFYKKWKHLPVVYDLFINYHGPKSQKKLKGIIVHFAGCNYQPPIPLWNPENAFYKEWKANLDRAELMDLSKVQQAKKWSFYKVYYYSIAAKIDFFALMSRKKLSDFKKYRLIPFFIYVITTPGRIVGIAGSIIKKHNPDLYDRLKGKGKKKLKD